MARHGEVRSDRIASRVKQLIRVWRAGGAVDDTRESWLHETDASRLMERLHSEADREEFPPPGAGRMVAPIEA